MKTKHRYGSHELSTPQQLGAGLGEAEEGARGSSRSPASTGAEMLGWERGNRSSTQPSLMGEGGFFFPFLASKGWEVRAWGWWRGFAKHRGLRLSTKNWARGQNPAAPRRSHGCKHLPPDIWNKKSPFGSLEPHF